MRPDFTYYRENEGFAYPAAFSEPLVKVVIYINPKMLLMCHTIGVPSLQLVQRHEKAKAQ